MSASSLPWVSFRGTLPRGERRRGTPDQFIAFLTTRHKAWSKDQAPGFSATRYRDHYVHAFTSERTREVRSFEVNAPSVWRSNAGVETLSALVQDVDHVAPDWQRLERTCNLIIVYSTWSDSPSDPHWRVVVPFAAEVPAELWPSAWQRGLERFDPNADPSCKDIGHFYWLPAAKPLELDRIRVRVIDGTPWAPEGLAVTPPETSGFALRPSVDRPATSAEQAAARRLLESTCRKLATHDPGGRQVATYGHARFVGHLIAANALDEDEATEALWAAVAGEGGNGVGAEREAEVRRAIRNGLARGVLDGAFVFEDPNVIGVTPLRERPVRRVLQVQVR